MIPTDVRRQNRTPLRAYAYAGGNTLSPSLPLCQSVIPCMHASMHPSKKVCIVSAVHVYQNTHLLSAPIPKLCSTTTSASTTLIAKPNAPMQSLRRVLRIPHIRIRSSVSVSVRIDGAADGAWVGRGGDHWPEIIGSSGEDFVAAHGLHNVAAEIDWGLGGGYAA